MIGTILTIIMFVFLLLLTVLWMIPVFNYENPQISLSRRIDNELTINFTEINYPMAFAIIDSFGKPLINQEKYIKTIMLTHSLNGNTSKFEVKNIEKCSSNLLDSKFGDMGKSFSNLIFTSVINDTFCIHTDQKNLIINNTFGSSNSVIITIFLSFCDNSTMNNTCKSPEVIQKTLENYFIYFLNTDISIDHTKIDPIEKIISYQPFTLNPSILRKQFLNYKKVYYNSDFNLFYNNKTSNTYYQIDSKTWDFSGFNSSNVIKNTFYEFIFTINSPISDVYSRNYIKVPQIIAQIGSIFSMTSFLFSFLLKTLFSHIPPQIVFDKVFKNENINKVKDDSKLKSMFKDSFVNNYIQNDSKNSFKANKTVELSKIRNLSVPILKNSYSEFWDFFREEIIKIVQTHDRHYLRSTFSCNRNAMTTSKINISKEIFNNFYDTRFIFTNLIDIFNFKESFSLSNSKKIN